MARTYKRDSRGRFASGGGSSGGGRSGGKAAAKSKPAATKRTAASKPKTKPVRGGQAERAMARAQSKLTAAMQAKDKIQGRNKSKERLAAYKGGATWERYQKRFNKANRSHTTAWKAKEYLKAQQAAKPATKAAKAATKRRGAPRTTSARGRALTNQRRAAALVSASRGGRGPSAKAVRSVLTAQRARAFYAATGGGKKRSAVKPAAKKTAKATAAAVRARTKAGSGGKAKGKAAGVRPAPSAKRRKTDQQIAEQVKRISEKAFDREKLFGESTLARLEGAVGRVVTRTRQRRERALANMDRLRGNPNAMGRKNYQRILGQDRARQRYYDLAWFADNLGVRQNNEIVAAIKRSRYERSPAGKSEKRRKRQAERKAAQEWVRRRL